VGIVLQSHEKIVNVKMVARAVIYVMPTLQDVRVAIVERNVRTVKSLMRKMTTL